MAERNGRREHARPSSAADGRAAPHERLSDAGPRSRRVARAELARSWFASARREVAGERDARIALLAMEAVRV